jgi:SpoVK/Ycf46/Vps4 family AAA+-type ATPase
VPVRQLRRDGTISCDRVILKVPNRSGRFLPTVTSDPLINSLRAAVEASPTDLPLRIHLAEMLAARGEQDEAVRHAAVVLQHEPDNASALSIITRGATGQPLPTPGPDPRPPTGEFTEAEQESLRRLEAGLEGVIPPAFVDGGSVHTGAYDVEPVGLRLADVGGMAEVKERLEASFLAPLRNPDLVRLYGKSLRGGLLLYGPPGCGKTFIARAVAGEMGAQFLAVSLAEILDMYVGQSERNLHELFETARRSAPCVVFLDEIDALGQKRSHLRNNAARGTVNQLLAELDGVENANEGVYVLGATNHPWDIDVALRRPGRFDRMLLVLPPDEEARQAVFRYHLQSRPVANVDLRRLARQTDGYSGADLAYICENAAERALLDSARSGTARMIGMDDLEQALADTKPSIGPWLETAKNVAQFANEGGTYDELLAYLRKRRLV